MLALEASTEVGVGQLVQICIRRPGCIAVVEGIGGQNGANGMVKRSIGGGIERNYAGKRAFDVLNDPNECLNKYKSELTVHSRLSRGRKRVGSELPTL